MNDATHLRPWRTTAVNLPEHGDNPVHTDLGARAAGYERALVAGTSVYAYLTHPPAAAWGPQWIGGGGAEVRFLSPVFDADEVECAIVDPGSDQPVVEARVAGVARATYAVSRHVTDAPVERSGDVLDPFHALLDDHLTGYAARAGDDLALYDERGIVHPAVWPVLANRVFVRYLIDGPWVHTRSRVVHLGLAEVGAVADVSATVIDRFSTRAGDRALVDVRIAVDGRQVAFIEHEAIIRLT